MEGKHRAPVFQKQVRGTTSKWPRAARPVSPGSFHLGAILGCMECNMDGAVSKTETGTLCDPCDKKPFIVLNWTLNTLLRVAGQAFVLGSRFRLPSSQTNSPCSQAGTHRVKSLSGLESCSMPVPWRPGYQTRLLFPHMAKSVAQ